MAEVITVVLAGVAALLATAWALGKRRHLTHPVTGGLHPEIALPFEAEFELYNNAFSHCSRKTRLVFAELGLSYRNRPIDLIETGAYETLSASFLRINPAGLVPTLVHKGHPVYESDEIMAYAALQAGEAGARLIPSDPLLRAEMERWIARAMLPSASPEQALKESAGGAVPGLTLPLFFTALVYIPPHRILTGLLYHPDRRRPFYFFLFKMLGPRRMTLLKPLRALIAASREAMEAHLLALEGQLQASGGPYILGESYSLADISWSAVFLRLEEGGWLDGFHRRRGLSRCRAWYEGVRARPSWREAILEHRHPIIDRAVADLAALRASRPDIRAALEGEAPGSRDA